MRITATEAKNRFGSVCAQAKREPVFVEKSGQVDTHALAHYAAPLPAKALRRPVANVAAMASVLVAAVDAVLSGI